MHGHNGRALKRCRRRRRRRRTRFHMRFRSGPLFVVVKEEFAVIFGNALTVLLLGSRTPLVTSGDGIFHDSRVSHDRSPYHRIRAISRSFGFSGNPQFCARASRVFPLFFFACRERFPAHKFHFLFLPADTHGEALRTGAALAHRPENIFHDSVFQRMERENARSSARFQSPRQSFYTLFQSRKLSVDFDPDRLKGLTRTCIIPVFRRNARLNDPA